MATSLAEQLKRLAAPQTSLLTHSKRKASLLFDPSEAANYDRQTIYEIGLSGLVELKGINQRFAEFEDTLFSQTSVSFERSVETKDINEKLNASIKKFLYLMSPYLLLKSSHKALEWLINRYHIHLFNMDDLIMLAIPYHETRIFARIIQILNFSDKTGRWHWLQPVQKAGVPLSKSVLLNHCASNPSFLKLLCDTVLGAVKVFRHGASALSTLTAFYCTTVIGSFEHSGKVSELQITHVLEALIRGYSSKSVDFAAASYMITAQLVTRASLSTPVLHRIVSRIITKMSHDELLPQSVLLLIIIYQNQETTISDVPVRALLRLGNFPDFPKVLGQIAATGNRVTPFLVPIMSQALSLIQSQNENELAMKTLVEELLNEVKLDKGDADIVVRTMIDGYRPTEEETSDENEKTGNDQVLKWYAQMLQRLERAYPTVFDAAVCRTLKGEGISAERARDLKILLGFELPLDLLDKLRHPKAKVRAHAAQSLSTKSSTFTEKDIAALRDSLGTFWTDDNPEVVSSALSFPETVLVDIMGKRDLQTALINLLDRCVHLAHLGKWSKVIEAAVERLCSLGAETDSEEIQVLLSLLPHLNEDEIAKKAFASNFGKQSEFLKRVRKYIKSKKAEEVSEAIVACLTKETNVVKPDSVLEAARLLKRQKFHDERWYFKRFYTSLFLAASFPDKAAPSLALKLLDENDKLLGNQKIVLSGANVDIDAESLIAGLKTSCERQLPAQCRYHLLSVLISRVDTQLAQLPSMLDLEDTDDSKFVVEAYRSILNGCSHPDKTVRSAFVNQMKLFFKTFCPTIQEQVTFLFNMSTFHALSSATRHLELSLRSLRLVHVFLSASPECVGLGSDRGNDSDILPAILLALQCPSPTIREVAEDVTRTLAQAPSGKNNYLKPLLEEISSRREEILLDGKQIRFLLEVALSPANQKKTKGKKEQFGALDSLLQCILSKSTPAYIVAGLLNALERVNSEEILKKLLPLVSHFLRLAEESGRADRHVSEILGNVLGRLNAQTCGCLANAASWNAIESAFKDQKTIVQSPSGKETRPAVLICQQINQSVWEALPKPIETYQEKILALLLEIGSVAEHSDVLSALSAVLRHIVLDSATVLPTLTRMKNVQVTEPETNTRRSRTRKSIHSLPSPLILQTDEWRQGLTLLELLQNKKKLNNVRLLVPILFDLLKRCLDFEEQAPVEYSKQVLLSCILQCCTKMHSDEKEPASKTAATDRVINVELVVQCVRASQNPQTHHHALLVLTHLAVIVPDQVLHNIMAIFTFMGSLVLRQDDAYSFQVTSKIMETIIPVLVKAGGSASASEATQTKLDETVASVVRVFVDALLDVPEHRRLALYHKLLTTLDANRFLWLFLCLVLESHVVHARSETSDPKRRGEQTDVPKRLEVALQLVNQFPAETIFTNCVALVQYVRMLPMEKDEKSGRRPPVPAELAKYNVPTLFSVEHHTPKVLRHYKYTIVTYLSALLSSMPLVSQISSLDEESIRKMEPLYRNFLANLLTLIQALHRQVDLSKTQQASKYWSVMLGQTCEILDKVNALLPSNMFINVISGLLRHNIESLRRKAMELLNARLSPAQNKSFMLTCDSAALLTLIKPLMDIVATIGATETENGEANSDDEMDEAEKVASISSCSEEVLLSQQTALLSLKLLARLLAYDHKDKFTPVLELVTKLLKKRAVPNDNILATLVLCCAELCSALRAHAIVALPTLMPAIIEVLSEYSDNLKEAPNLVLLSVVSSVLRVVETLPNFLSQYLKLLLEKICVLLARCSRKGTEEGDGSKFTPIVNKLLLTGQKISTSISSRVLVPAVRDCYKVLLDAKAQIGVGPLMTVLSDSFAGLSPPDLRNLMTDLTDFFLSALNYRCQWASDESNTVSTLEVESVEGHVIKAWVSLVLKLSETSFKPLYYKIYDWATRMEIHKDRVITFYRLSYSVSDCLKGLFPSFSGYFLKNAAMLLDHCNVTKVGERDETEFDDQEEKRPEELYFGSGDVAEEKCAYLVEHILRTLKNVFLYDSQGFVNKETFESLVRPIIDQLENTVSGIETLQTRAEQVLIPCIAQFAVALDDDIMWKQINYQVLLKTKHKNPQIRLIALEAVCKVVHKLGESFLPLIPETIPFLAELLEDEDESVETACRHAVQDLEQVLGEPLQKYF